MIPKMIHYCWFGRNPKPKLSEKCIKSWKKYCPDYEIIEWNEDNFDISTAPLYVRQAYEAKKWAFVTDYVRLQVVYENGGIYLDTDVELKKKPDHLLKHEAYFAFEDGIHINTGLGFGAVAGHPILKAIMDDYEGISFIKEDGSYDQETCPSRNTKVFLRYGLHQDDCWQILEDDVLILPSIYLCPISYKTRKHRHSTKTISIHWFDASWKTEEQIRVEREWNQKKGIIKLQDLAHNLLHTPHRVVRHLLGDSRYEQLKTHLKI